MLFAGPRCSRTASPWKPRRRSAPKMASSAGEILDLLCRLVDKSLVLVETARRWCALPAPGTRQPVRTGDVARIRRRSRKP